MHREHGKHGLYWQWGPSCLFCKEPLPEESINALKVFQTVMRQWNYVQLFEDNLETNNLRNVLMMQDKLRTKIAMEDIRIEKLLE